MPNLELGSLHVELHSKALNMHACIHVDMGHKNINVSDEAYNALASLRFPGESFTTAILRLLKYEKPRGVDLRRFYGKWDITDKEMTEIDTNLKKLWKTWKLP